VHYIYIYIYMEHKAQVLLGFTGLCETFCRLVNLRRAKGSSFLGDNVGRMYAEATLAIFKLGRSILPFAGRH
jgi:hypothetical protein